MDIFEAHLGGWPLKQGPLKGRPIKRPKLHNYRIEYVRHKEWNGVGPHEYVGGEYSVILQAEDMDIAEDDFYYLHDYDTHEIINIERIKV